MSIVAGFSADQNEQGHKTWLETELLSGGLATEQGEKAANTNDKFLEELIYVSETNVNGSFTKEIEALLVWMSR